jgi:hypothetical protein
MSELSFTRKFYLSKLYYLSIYNYSLVVINVIGKPLSKMIWENKLSDDAIPDAIMIFANYANCSESGEITYLRILLNLLSKKILINLMLQQFTKAATLYAPSGINISLRINNFKLASTRVL